MKMHYAKHRAKFAQTLITIHKIMRDTYQPDISLDAYLDLFPIVSAVFIEETAGRPPTSSTVAKMAEVPRTTALRRLSRLTHDGHIVRRGTRFYMTDEINKPGMRKRLKRVVAIMSAISHISYDLSKMDKI